VLWVRGRNVFMLRHALHLSGGDTVLPDLLRRDALAYAGYSAGPCVLAPSLRGLDAGIYGTSPIFDGLGVLPYAIVPHYRSPDHPENAACDQVAARYASTGVPHRTFRDGQALVIDGVTEAIC
jgi:dipeptidase E